MLDHFWRPCYRFGCGQLDATSGPDCTKLDRRMRLSNPMPLEVVVATIAVHGEGRPDGSQGNVFFS